MRVCELRQEVSRFWLLYFGMREELLECVGRGEEARGMGGGEKWALIRSLVSFGWTLELGCGVPGELRHWRWGGYFADVFGSTGRRGRRGSPLVIFYFYFFSVGRDDSGRIDGRGKE